MTYQPFMSLRERFRQIESGELDPVSWAEAHNHFVTAANQSSRAMVDHRPVTAENASSFLTSYKDMINVVGFDTRCNSQSFMIRPRHSARIVEMLEARNFHTVGKARTTEFSVGSDVYDCLNPRFPEFSPAGSSNGSASSVAAGLCDFSVGTEAAGSTRWPADHCGIVGMKLTYLEELHPGLIPVSPSLDSIGLIARTVDDLAFAWERGVLDESLSQKYPFWEQNSAPPLRIGIATNYKNCRCHPEIIRTFEKLMDTLLLSGSDEGIDLEWVELDWWDYRVDTWTIIGRELFDLHHSNPAFRDIKIKDGTQLAISAGAEISDDVYEKMLENRKTARRKADDTLNLKNFQAILMPLDANLPTRINQKRETTCVIPNDDDQTSFDNMSFTSIASITGLPAMTIPADISDSEGCPISLQILGPRYGESVMLQIGAILEKLILRQFGRDPGDSLTAPQAEVWRASVSRT